MRKGFLAWVAFVGLSVTLPSAAEADDPVPTSPRQSGCAEEAAPASEDAEVQPESAAAHGEDAESEENEDAGAREDGERARPTSGAERLLAGDAARTMIDLVRGRLHLVDPCDRSRCLVRVRLKPKGVGARFSLYVDF